MNTRVPTAAPPHQPLQRLGDLSVARFMRDAWQRKPLLIRNAITGFRPPLGRERVFALAADDAAESRLVEQVNGRWRLQHGPFARLPSVRRGGWTVLVQGVDGLDEAAYRLLQRFRFVPDARLDDLMVSYATDGGGVGPHVDSYDVFLLQTHGRRRWRISRQRDLRLVADAPLRVLADFRASAEYVLEPGDMLYLPPGVAHEGTALGECITCSIGFRAPTYQELLEPLLVDFAARADLRGRYADRGLQPTRRPAALPLAMVGHLHAALTVRMPQRADTVHFLLGSLTEPKAQVVFDRPRRASGTAAFARAALQSGVVLDRRTRLLYSGTQIGINGEVHAIASAQREALRCLADERRLIRGVVDAPLAALLHPWHAAGWLHVGSA